MKRIAANTCSIKERKRKKRREKEVKGNEEAKKEEKWWRKYRNGKKDRKDTEKEG